MDEQVTYLYKQIKEKKISQEDAIKQIKEYKIKNSREDSTAPGIISENSKASGICAASLLDKLQAALMQTISELLMVTVDDVNAEWSEYGFDQVMLTVFADRINQEYKLELVPNIFYEILTIHSLAVYLLAEYQDVFVKQFPTEVLQSPSNIEKHNAVAEIGEELLQEKAISYFKKLLSSVLKLPVNRIEEDAPMDEYGIDSIMVMQLTNELEEKFGSLSKTLFFEYENIRQIAGYFLENYRDQLIGLLGIEENVAISENPNNSIAVESVKSAFRSFNRPRPVTYRIKPQSEDTSGALDVAIIGVSGRYPGAGNIQEFWKNLREGRDCITEVPKERWDHSTYFDEDKNKFGKTYSKWGGFLEGVDQFDPLFFNISPREAQYMDPQERMFLECVFETIEDAGYTRQNLGLNQSLNLERNIGVYVGVMYEEYQLYGAQEQIQGRPVALGGNISSVANRVSYFCNFHGPSMAVDTMCSSSLTAIHLACQSLQQGECELAIAGGVNISIHVNKYLLLGQGKMLSSKGRCQSFGQGGDGYVPGEGVGAVLLKPVAKAIADNDHIYGIIKATSVNHGGKTNGYTVPSPNAQARVIGKTFKEAGINPRTISYIEAHGTGTSLGDPIEIAGLTKIFQEYTTDKQFCAIGSAKANIGHCESAAGIAGVTKVLLQLKHRQLVPSLHSEVLNPNIDFSNTPFVVQQELTEWKRPVIESSEKNVELPRRAGISSFGAGGSNAHVVIEEYIPDNEVRPPIEITTQHPAIIVLSAKNEDRLQEQAKQLLAAIREQQLSDVNLADMAYTLQVGREAMEERLAVLVDSVKKLEETLNSFIEGKNDIEGLYRGQVKRNKEALAALTADEDMETMVRGWISKGKYTKLLDLWAKGLIFDWNKLYGDNKPCRISLPTYPFAKERYWVPDTQAQAVNSMSTNFVAFHPLLQRNTSDFSEQRFSSTFGGQEFFLKDHTVKGQGVLPGVVYLEMARAAVEQAVGSLAKEKNRMRLKNVVWTRPIAVGEEPVQVHIGLSQDETGEIAYEIYSRPDDSTEEAVVHSQGSADFISSTAAVVTLDLKALQAECNQSILSAAQCYEIFEKMGIAYGPGHQGIEKLYVGLDKAVAKLTLPTAVMNTQNQFVLHPSVMDSALQATIGLMVGADNLKSAVPFALQELEVIQKCTSSMWALIQYSDGRKVGDKVQKLDIDICDDQGIVCVRMKGFSTRFLEGEIASGTKDGIGMLMYQPSWEEQQVASGTAGPEYGQHVVMLCELKEGIKESITSQLPEVRCITLKTASKSLEKRFLLYAVQILEEIKNILNDKPKGQVLIQLVTSVQKEQQLFSGLSGLLKTAHLENAKLIGQVIEVEDSKNVVEKLQKETNIYPVDNRVRYQGGKRLVGDWSEIENFYDTKKIPWKDQGIYLITGGAGGLGLIFAQEIGRQVRDAILIFTGRSVLNKEKQAKVKELEALGARIEYRQVDVTDETAVIRLLQNIQDEFGGLNGILHCAGVIRDNFIIKKTKEEMQEVLAPKVSGLVNLDQASKEMKLDFFILFSSIAGSLGSVGQADYAAANSFMDAYAEYRSNLVALQQRQGQTLSINWPLWKDGGMHVDEETEKMMMHNMGMIAMQSITGVRALYQSLASGNNQVMVMEGLPVRMKQRLLSPRNSIIVQANTSVESATLRSDSNYLLAKIKTTLMHAVAELLKVKLEDIDSNTELNEYGFDSITFTEFANKLNKNYKLELPPTVFFEYSTIQSFAEYLMQEYRAQMESQFELDTNDARHSIVNDLKENIDNKRQHSRVMRSKPLIYQKTAATDKESIAIVGINGKFPMAEDVDEFWRNLMDGKECITEIPRERWDWRDFYQGSDKEVNEASIKWGGFISEIDVFDSSFFRISPKEAETMDPRQRLLLTSVWRAMEDAGITPQEMSKRSTGVFIAASPSECTDHVFMQENSLSLTAIMPTVIPSRISYVLDLHGPSEYCDTACSSAVVALHRAVQAIRNGECEQAIVGAVNLLLSPIGFIGLDAMGYLSPEGKAKPFQTGANGYVRSEGVGVIIIKPLPNAINDQDRIYAVVKGTGVSHGGKGMSLTAPNANGMKAAMIQAYQAAKIDPRAVSYIEAHGIASPLGDGIEISALKAGYQELVALQPQNIQVNRPCYISNLKSSIGHGEVVSGMAALIKTILAMQHKVIPAIPQFTALSEYISFEDGPFKIAAENYDWEAVKDVHGNNLPRRVSINSYGFSGINAHLVLEEYTPLQEETIPTGVKTSPQALPLSAKNNDRLKDYAQSLLIFLKRGRGHDLADIAYTFQVGRQAMETRVVFVVNNINELIQKLEAFIDGKENIEDCFIGDVKQGKDAVKLFGKDEDFKELIHKWIAKGKVKKIAELWSNGLPVDWELLYSDAKPQRISMPTYPFARERYGIFLQQEKKPSVMIETEKMCLSGSEKFAQGNLRDTLECVTKLVRDTLGISSNVTIDPQTQLREYGMDSIFGIQILEKVKREWGIQLDGRRFFSEFTLQSIVNQLESATNQSETRLLPWEIDKKLPENLMLNPKVLPFKHSSSPKKVFLTGATGLVGAFLCHEILQQTSANVYCLIRAKSTSLGLQRIRENFDKYELWQSDYQLRIIPVLGDITKPQMGIEKEHYDELSQSIETIYHCAAIPNHLLNYYSLKSSNVNGTLSVIEFAGNHRIKSIHFTSTVGVCSQMEGDTILPSHQRETLLDHGRNLPSGYAQSKWVSEHHLMQAHEQGIPITIFRCGEITGSSQTGHGIAQDMVHNFFKIFSEVEVIPQWDDGVIDIVPIDYITQAILAVSLQKNSFGKIYNLNNPNPIPVKEFFNFLQKKKPALSIVSFEEWADCCLLYIKNLPESTIKTIMMEFFAKPDSGFRIFEYYYFYMNLSNDNTQKALQKTKVQFPQLDEKWWEKCMNQISLFDWNLK